MVEEPQAGTKKPKHRSPSYPAIDLATALERTEQLWRHAQRHYVPVTDAMRVWGYSAKSSGGLQTIGALNRFELIEDQGKGPSRQIRVSELGRAIVTDDPNSAERAARIQEAALTPKIHRELWDRYEGDLPPDSTLRWDLLNIYSFGEGAARELIDELRRTVEFAGLAEGEGILSPSYQEPTQTEMTPSTPKQSPPVPHLPGSRQPPGLGLQLPIRPGKAAVLQGPFPVTEEEWSLMMAVLQAMKPGLVAREETSAPDPEPEL
jgi:hypothetical protein